MENGEEMELDVFIPWLDRLANEVLIHVFAFLDPIDWIRFSIVCKRYLFYFILL
jgi:hypothetical protein